MASEVRQRKGKTVEANAPSSAPGSLETIDNDNGKGKKQTVITMDQILKHKAVRFSLQKWRLFFVLLSVLSFITRFWKINHPAQVVFDEVHFGKFASFYLQRKYYFDVHPPLGKLLLAATGYLAGYRGHFLFDNIGDSYITNNVPYVALRAFPAFCGALVPMFVFLIMKEMGFSLLGSTFACLMVIFDNALVTQSRLILLDSMLLLFCIMCVYGWVKFYRERYSPFRFHWWKWLLFTGVSLGLATGVKMVGLFTVGLIGIATLCDLWRLLDYRRGLTMREFTKHFMARALALIVVPMSLYLFYFYLHFNILIYSGPGDDFMSPAFQATLRGNAMNAGSFAIPYGANITLKHKNTNHFLHSHVQRYPLRYDDGRVSSQGQQVTGYPFDDINNVWAIEPVNCERYPEAKAQCDRVFGDKVDKTANTDTQETRHVRHGDLVRLRHLLTNTYLLTHDVASPLTTTNMEVTTLNTTLAAERYKETLWKIDVVEKPRRSKDPFLSSKSAYFKMVNAQHNVAIHSYKSALPEWGFKQQEINGNKNVKDSNNMWVVLNVTHSSITEERIAAKNAEVESPDVPQVHFMLKFLELQRLMIVHNSGLTKPHPFQSHPFTWPLMTRGISFWENKKTFEQIYLIGNVTIWFFNIVLTGCFAALWVLDRLALQRNVDEMGMKVRLWWDRSVGFLFLAWFLHFFPFFLMGRSLFLHHYFPAFVLSCMCSAGIVDFLAKFLSDGIVVGVPEREGGTVGLEVYFPFLEYYLGRTRVISKSKATKPKKDDDEEEDEKAVRARSVVEFGWGHFPSALRSHFNSIHTPALYSFLVIFLTIVFIVGFWIFAPYVYGTGFGTTDEASTRLEVAWRKWLPGWDFQWVGR